MPPKALNIWSRKLHRWVSLAIGLPVALVIATGLMLQVKKESDWIQPPTAQASGGDPTLAMADLLDIARGVEEMRIAGWDDIDRIDVRPAQGIAKVRASNRWETQIDLATGEVLQTAYRRSDLIESLHDGSWFGDFAKLYVFLPAGLGLFALWLTGLYLLVLPWWARRARRRRMQRAPQHRRDALSGGVS